MITCQSCHSEFQIFPEDRAFYAKINVPEPTWCPDCRFYERFALRNPRKLWHRQCMCTIAAHGHPARCQTEFETSYAPERPETIYCEACYQKEVL